MRTSRRLVIFLVMTLLCGIFATGCDDILSDPNFHTWCGDQLCSWKLDSGQIRRAPTWHPKDYGVELLDSTDATHITAISQIVDKTPTCLEFTTVADVAAEAQVSIGVDFDNDGTFEYEQPIAATGFTAQKTQITAPLTYTNIRFVIMKKGSGRAVLAQMDVRSKTDCTAPPVALKPQVQGTTCGAAGHGIECISRICCDGMCAECCAKGGPQGKDEDGGVLPDPTDTCSDGAKCGTLGRGVPRQCDPGTAKRPAHIECLLNEDCASGVCTGAVWEIHNEAVGGGPCPPPPGQGKDCRVSVRAGVCR